MKAVLFPELNRNFNLTANSLPFFGQTLLERQLAWLKSYSAVDEIIIVAKELPANLAGTKDILFVPLKGEGFNIASVKEFLDSDPFILILGNIFSLEVLERIFKHQKDNKANLLFYYTDKQDCQDGFFVDVAEKNGELKNILYNELSCQYYLANIFYIDPELLSYFVEDELDFHLQFLPEIIKRKKKIQGLKTEGYYRQINSPTIYFQTLFEIFKKDILELTETKIGDNFCGDNCVLDFSCRTEKRNYFGNNFSAGPETKIKNTIVFNDCSIGKNVILNNSLVLPGTKLGDNCELNGVLLGENCKLGSNVRLTKGLFLAQGSKINDYSGVSND